MKEKIAKSGQEGEDYLGIVGQLERVRLFPFSVFELRAEFTNQQLQVELILN